MTIIFSAGLKPVLTGPSAGPRVGSGSPTLSRTPTPPASPDFYQTTPVRPVAIVATIVTPPKIDREFEEAFHRDFRGPGDQVLLIEALGDSHFPSVRGIPRDLWEEMRGPRSVDTLIVVLRYPCERVRANAAQVLGWSRDPRAVDPLIEALTDPCGDVREEAAKALAKIGDPRAVDPLIEALTDPNMFVPIKAASALNKIEMKWFSDHLSPKFSAPGSPSAQIFARVWGTVRAARFRGAFTVYVNCLSGEAVKAGDPAAIPVSFEPRGGSLVLQEVSLARVESERMFLEHSSGPYRCNQDLEELQTRRVILESLRVLHGVPLGFLRWRWEAKKYGSFFRCIWRVYEIGIKRWWNEKY